MSKKPAFNPLFTDIWNCVLSCLALSAYFITARYMETLSIDPFSVSSVFLLLGGRSTPSLPSIRRTR